MWTRRFSSSSRLQKMCLSRWIRRNPVHWKAGRLWRNTSSLFGMAKTLNTLGEHSVREDYTKCNYWIQSPSDTVIEVQLAMFTRGVVVDGCELAGVEIKTNEDQTRTGYRFCSYYDRGTTLRSHSNLVPVITYNRHLRTTAILKYRYVPASSPSTAPPTSVAKELSDT